MTSSRPVLVEGPPSDAIDAMVARVLDLASTWRNWNGGEVDDGGRIYTPNKAIRRVADHMLDHLAQLEAHLGGVPSLPDNWHASAMTSAADLAPFAVEDLDEARCRLLRLAAIWRLRLESVAESELDRADGDAYTIREMASCAAASIEYADAIGQLVPT
jgi:hypothetical protein